MSKWVEVQNKDYQTPVRSFNWSDNGDALVVRFDRPLPIHADKNVICTEFSPVPKKSYDQLKNEVESQEQLVNGHHWFFHDVRDPDSIKEKIETESSVSEVEMRHLD